MSEIEKKRRQKISEKLKKYWQTVSQEKRSALGRSLAKTKNDKMTAAERKAHSKMMLSKLYPEKV